MNALADRLRHHVSVLALDIGERHMGRPHALAAAARYIESGLIDIHRSVRRQTYELHGIECANIETEYAGTEPDGAIVLVGAHYDTVPGSPGADDNASGVAAMIEMARLLSGQRMRCSVRFVAFVNEEPPFFYSRHMGSAVYARAARARGERINVMLSLEMLGYYSACRGSQHYPPFLRFFYPERGNFIGFVSNLASRRVLVRVHEAFQAHSSFPSVRLASPAILPGVSWSDHRSFWRAGYPAIMVTDTAFYRYPHYHARSDTPQKLDFMAMASVTAGLAEAVAELAGRECV